MFLAIPFDQQVTDTYFVVAHFHYIIFGAAVFPIFGGMYYWFPKVTGKLYFERPGQISFWIIFVGHEPAVLPDAHRRAARHAAPRLHLPERPRLGRPTTCSRRSAASCTLVGILLLLGNLVCELLPRRARRPRPVARPDARVDDAARRRREYNFAVIPTVTSAYPNWDDADRAEDRGSSSAGVLVLDEGHEQVATSPVDAHLAEVVEMPHESPWPIAARARAARSSSRCS